MYKIQEKLAIIDNVVDYIRKTGLRGFAADYAGVPRRTLEQWEKNDKKLHERINTAKAEWVRGAVSKAKSQEWLLERVAGADFAPPAQKLEVETTLMVKLDVGNDKVLQQIKTVEPKQLTDSS